MENLFELEQRDTISVLTVKSGGRGLPITDHTNNQLLWSILQSVSVKNPNVLLVKLEKDVFAPQRVNEAWDEISRAEVDTHLVPPQIRAMRNNIKKLIDYQLNSRVFTIAAFSGLLDLDLLGLLLICNYRICTEESTIENQSLDRPAPPGAAWFISRVVGHGLTNTIYLDNESLTAQEARDIKLVNEIASSNDLDSFSEKKAEFFASKSKLALSTLTEALNNQHLNLADYLEKIGTGFESLYSEE